MNVKLPSSTLRSVAITYCKTKHHIQDSQPNQQTFQDSGEFGWYNWVLYRQEGEAFPFNHQKLGRVLGPAKGADTEMSQWVLTGTGEITPIQSLRLLNNTEKNSPTMQDRQKAFTAFIKKKLGDSMTPLAPPHKPYPEAIISPGENEAPDDTVYEKYEGWYDDN